MSGSAWVNLALEKLSCSQKELAIRLGVSPTQISKWKNDEHMSCQMEDKFRELSGIGDKHPQFVLWTGSLENADKWERIVSELAELAADSAETGYDTAPLRTEVEQLCWGTFYTLEQMGVAIPKTFPAELEQLAKGEADDEDFELAMVNPYADLISRIYKALNDVYGFYVAFVDELINDDQPDLFETGMEIESCLMDLAASKLDISADLAPNFSNFRYETLKAYEEWVGSVKTAALRFGVPVRAELLDLVRKGHDELGFNAEAESLGVNESRIHPDIYMNELLVGMRALHQVLPVIVKKLGITPEELNFDVSELSA